MARRRQKHVPQRTCIACGEKFDKRHLNRLVRSSEGNVTVDPTGKQAGRGAYLCGRTACWDRALSSNLLDRALRTTLSAAEKEALASSRPHEEDDV